MDQYGNFFKNIDDPAKAYFLGLYYADGYIKNGSLTLADYDREILDRLKEVSRADTLNISIMAPREDRFSKLGQARISMTREKFHLMKHLGCHKEVLPQLSDDLMSHFIRGVFDGDGCISIDSRTTCARFQGECYLLFNLESHAYQVRDFLVKKCQISQLSVKTKRGMGAVDIFKIRWGGCNNLISIRNLIYRNHGFFCLKRKYDKFVKIGTTR